MTAAASTCAASWRISSRAFGPSFLVRMAMWAPSGSGRERSRSWAPGAGSPSPPSGVLTSTASAARASPGPIAAAASAPLAPSGSCSALPSGSVTVIISALEATRRRRGFSRARRGARGLRASRGRRPRASARAAGRSGEPPEGVVGERLAGGEALAEQLDQLALGGVAVGRLVVLRHDRGDLLGDEAVGERGERLARVLRRLAAREGGVEVGDEHVVGLDRLKAAGLQAVCALALGGGGGGEDERRRRVADRPVGLARLALEVGGAALGLARLLLVLLVAGEHPRVVDRAHDRLDVEALDARERTGDGGVLVEQQRRGEPGELQRAQRLVLASGGEQARGDDRAAGARGGGHACARRHQQGHAEAPEVALLAERGARGRVAGVEVALGILGEADRDQPPAQLLAVAPAQHRERGAGGVR